MAMHYAVHCAEHGRKVFVLDLDHQRHSVKRLTRLPHDIATRHIAAEELHQRVLSMIRKGRRPTPIDRCDQYDIVILDAPGSLDLAKPAFLVSDLVALPCVPSKDDLTSTVETLKRVEEVRRKRAGLPLVTVFLNRATERRTATRQAVEVLDELAEHGVPVCEARIGARAAFENAALQDTVVFRLSRGAEEARTELVQLFEEIDDYARKASEFRSRIDARSRGAKGGGRRDTTRNGNGASQEALTEKERRHG